MSKTVLLVEDDTALSEVYTRALKQANLKVYVASDVEMAMRKAQKHKPDVMLLDIILGPQNGFQLLKRLRREPGTMDIPVIIVTNLLTSEVGMQQELRVSLGVVGIYTKSQLSLKKLVQIVEHTIQRK